MATYTKSFQPAPERFGQLPTWAGVVFVCRACGWRRATTRDNCLKAWGERGETADAARKLRCGNCKRRGAIAPFLTPPQVGFGSKGGPIDRLVEAIRNLRVYGRVNDKEP